MQYPRSVAIDGGGRMPVGIGHAGGAACDIRGGGGGIAAAIRLREQHAGGGVAARGGGHDTGAVLLREGEAIHRHDLCRDG